MSDKIAYLLDFDGTITTKDISKELAIYYDADSFWEMHRAYKSGDLGMRDWLEQASALLPADLDILIEKALDCAVIRPGFTEFLQFAEDLSRPVAIASDGFGFYIEPILNRIDQLGKIERIFMNEILLSENTIPSIRFTHAHCHCDTCGNCKASHVNWLKNRGYSVVFVGDGTNDRYGASAADLVIARDRLADFCEKNSLAYKLWTDFYDIIS